MRTLVATVMTNHKGNEIYCWNRKVNSRDSQILRSTDRSVLEQRGFTFINFISPEYPNIAGYAIFFEGHLDEMSRDLKAMP